MRARTARHRWAAPGALVVVTLVALGARAGAGDEDGSAGASPTTATTPAPTTPAPAPSAPAPTAVPASGAGAALDALAAVTVVNEHRGGYDRDLFGYPRDEDRDGCDTRAEVLIRDSTTSAQIDPYRCFVVAGEWSSPYDGAVWSDPGEVQIDHVVALKEAWDSGAWAWPADRLVAFGNDVADPRSLRAVTSGVNQAKSDADPSNWIPQDGDVCAYLADWVAIKVRWDLSMDQSEHGRIGNLLEDRCSGEPPRAAG